jgi:hypothetical protein
MNPTHRFRIAMAAVASPSPLDVRHARVMVYRDGAGFRADSMQGGAGSGFSVDAALASFARSLGCPFVQITHAA